MSHALATATDLRWGRDRAQRVTVKGVRVFARKNGPIVVQVFVGRKWVSVAGVPGVISKEPVNSTGTARWIKHQAKRAGVRSIE